MADYSWVTKCKSTKQKKRRRFVYYALDENEMAHCNYCKVEIHFDEMVNGTRKLTVDHIIPLSRGGADHYDNYMILCRECNRRKGSLTCEEYSDLMRYRKGEGLSKSQMYKIIDAFMIDKGFKD